MRMILKNKFTGQTLAVVSSKNLLGIFDEHNQKIESLIGNDYVKTTVTKYKTIRGKVSGLIINNTKDRTFCLTNLILPF